VSVDGIISTHKRIRGVIFATMRYINGHLQKGHLEPSYYYKKNVEN